MQSIVPESGPKYGAGAPSFFLSESRLFFCCWLSIQPGFPSSPSPTESIRTADASISYARCFWQNTSKYTYKPGSGTGHTAEFRRHCIIHGVMLHATWLLRVVVIVDSSCHVCSNFGPPLKGSQHVTTYVDPSDTLGPSEASSYLYGVLLGDCIVLCFVRLQKPAGDGSSLVRG